MMLQNYVTVVGSRGIYYPTTVEVLLSDNMYLTSDVVISGGAPGVDRHSVTLAVELGKHTCTVPANWNKRRGKGAGYRRNEVLAKLTKDLDAHLIVLWDGSSPGTGHWVQEGGLIYQYQLPNTVYQVNKDDGSYFLVTNVR